MDAEEELLELKEEFARRLGAADKAIAALKVPSLLWPALTPIVVLFVFIQDLLRPTSPVTGSMTCAKPVQGDAQRQ